MDISIKWNVCRICLLEDSENTGGGNESCESQMRYIFSDCKLSKQILECSGVLIQPNDCLPQKICRRCLTILRFAVSFRRTCRTSNEYLQNIIQKAKSATSLFNLNKPRQNSLEMADNDVFSEADTEVDYAFEKVDEISSLALSIKEKSETCTRKTHTSLQSICSFDSAGKNEVSPDVDRLENRLTETLLHDLVGPTDKDNVKIQDCKESRNYEIVEVQGEQLLNNCHPKESSNSEISSEINLEVFSIDNDVEIGEEQIAPESQLREVADTSRGSPLMTAVMSRLNEEVEEGQQVPTEIVAKDEEKEFFYVVPSEIKSEVDANDGKNENEDLEVAEQPQYIEFDDEVRSVNALTEEETVEYLLESSDEQSQPEFVCTDNFSDNTAEVDKAERMGTKRKKNDALRIFICHLCGNQFTNKNLLNFHMKIHRNEKTFECELCYKRFNASCNLSAHMRTHTGEKPYQCQHCNRRFSDRSTHIKHERIHTNEKPYVCTACGKAFSLSTSLKAHHKVHTGEKPFRCDPCSKSFKLPHQLKAHLKTHLHKVLADNERTLKYNC